MRLRAQLVHHVFLQAHVLPLPELLVLSQIFEGDRLHIGPEAGLYRLQHRRILNVHETELPRQIPDKVLATEARTVHLLQLVHCGEDLRGLDEVRRRQPGWGLDLPEAVVHLLPCGVDELRDVLQGRSGHALGHAPWAQLLQQLAHVEGGDSDGRGPVSASRLAPSHPPMPVVLHHLREPAVVGGVGILREAELPLKGDVDAAICLLCEDHHRRIVLVVEEVQEELAAPCLPGAVARHRPDLRREVRLAVTLDEAPKLLLAPSRHHLRDGVHLQLHPVLELELHTENDPEQAIRAPPVPKILLIVYDSDATVGGHDPHACDIAVDEPPVVSAAMRAVGNETADLEEVGHGLRWQEVALGANPSVQVGQRPPRIDRRPPTVVRQVVQAELPIAGSRILREGHDEDVHV
mmetsp:Transcript_38883/g.111699  ORF Transcript_38883/g.111699 Transcript_38883/m.111699 type:complete len:407 (-) Transcript_38883:729-1949(-)